MQRMTWEQMVEAYPDKWVAIRNPIMDGEHPDILEGDVVTVLSDDEISEYEASHQDQNLTYCRTTESGWNGMFYADFSITTL
ncbi:MAG: hypothetical protein IJT05_07475 [Lachnospiraceae bacterium]|nr:hypothetical protein [Lachnospiraceae bacterium]